MDVSRTTVFSQHRTLHSCTQLREDGLRPSLPLSVSARCWAITGPQWVAAYAVIHHKISITNRKEVVILIDTEPAPGKLKSIPELHTLLMSVKEVVVLDIETTGFSPEKHAEIIEIGALILDVERCKVLDKFSTFVHPSDAFTIPPKIQEVTKITWKDVADAPYIEEVLPDFAKFIGNRPVVAHNAAFDWTRFLVPMFRTVGLHMVNDAICSMLLSKELFPGVKGGYNLKAMCEMYGVDIEGHHRALVDARYTASLFLKLVQEYRYRHINYTPPDLLNRAASYRKPAPPAQTDFRGMRVLRVSCYEGASKRAGKSFYVTTSLGRICYSARRRLWKVVQLNTDLNAPAQLWGNQVLTIMGLDADSFVRRYDPDRASA